MTTPDSPVADKFVAAPDNWSRGGAPIKAIVIHMAEGGGTVSWLTRDDGNSSHYVVEYDGTVTQMVLESRAAGSINPKLVRTSDDAPYTYLGETIVYGRTAQYAALGAWSSNPNAAVIAIEVEGFAVNGPNAAERDALRRLVADIRRRNGTLPTLGHRDFQDYKSCPGHLIPWVDYGGHGVATTEEGPMGLRIKLDATLPDGVNGLPDLFNNFGTTTLKSGSIRNVGSGANVALPAGTNLGIVQTGYFLGEAGGPAFDPAVAIFAFNNGNEQHIVPRSQCSPLVPIPAPTCPEADCTDEITAATQDLNDEIRQQDDEIARLNQQHTADGLRIDAMHQLGQQITEA